MPRVAKRKTAVFHVNLNRRWFSNNATENWERIDRISTSHLAKVNSFCFHKKKLNTVSDLWRKFHPLLCARQNEGEKKFIVLLGYSKHVPFGVQSGASTNLTHEVHSSYLIKRSARFKPLKQCIYTSKSSLHGNTSYRMHRCQCSYRVNSNKH